jgi:hypothetical protein
MDHLSKIIKVSDNLSSTTYTQSDSATTNTSLFISDTAGEADDPFFKIDPLPLQPINSIARKQAR